MNIIMGVAAGWKPLNCAHCRFQARCETFDIRHNTLPAERVCPLVSALPAQEVTEGRLFVEYTTHQKMRVFAVPMADPEKHAE